MINSVRCCLVRQVLKACSYKMDPIRKSDGYTKGGKKTYKRYFIVKKLKEIGEKPIIMEELDCSKNTLNVDKKYLEKHN